MAPNSLFQQGDPGARDGSGISPGRETPELFRCAEREFLKFGWKRTIPAQESPFPLECGQNSWFFLTPDSRRVPRQEFPKDSRRGEAEMFHAEFLSLN